jgi:hypothetical protein
LAQRGGGEGDRAGFEAFDRGYGAEFRNFFNYLEHGRDDLTAAFWAHTSREIGYDMGALFHKVVTCGVPLQSDAFCKCGPSFEGVLARDGKNAACGFEVLKGDAARTFQIGFCDIEESFYGCWFSADDH